jgi:hypothetical protein
LRFADFQRVIDSANSQNVLAGMNVVKVILPIGSCHCLANKAELLIRLHLEKRDSDSDKGARKTDDTSSQVGSTQYRGGHYEHFQQQNETQKVVAHREINDSMLLPAAQLAQFRLFARWHQSQRPSPSSNPLS